jgi:hypothetical protein
LDNFELSSSISEIVSDGPDATQCTADDTRVTIDQIAALRNAARNTPGCKITGTNTDCTSVSDVRTDVVIADAAAPFLDLSLVTVTKDEPSAIVSHEVMGPFDRAILERASAVDYYTLLDEDQDPSTGGGALDLGLDDKFVGVDFAVRVRVGHGMTTTATAWRYENGVFVELVDRPIVGFIEPVVAVSESGTERIADRMVAVFPETLLSAGLTDFDVHALVVVRAEADVVEDILDFDRIRNDLRLRSPTFPTCEVTPPDAMPGDTVTVSVDGLLPESAIHIVLGDQLVGTGVTDGAGSSAADFTIPPDSPDGFRLVTVGVDETALTADCTLALGEEFRGR